MTIVTILIAVCVTALGTTSSFYYTFQKSMQERYKFSNVIVEKSDTIKNEVNEVLKNYDKEILFDDTIEFKLVKGSYINEFSGMGSNRTEQTLEVLSESNCKKLMDYEKREYKQLDSKEDVYLIEDSTMTGLFKTNLEQPVIISEGKRNFKIKESYSEMVTNGQISGVIIVVKYRLSENIFNLVDTFDLYKTSMGVIEMVYLNYYEELKTMLKNFLDIDFEIIVKNDKIIGEKKVLAIGNGIEKLSSGYQAILRLFLELIYFEDSVEDDITNPVVVIDETNEFLSTKNEEKILPFLINRFSNMNFIVTPHSADVVASSIDCNIIVLSDNSYECLDGNDFSSITDVREIFEKFIPSNIYTYNDEEKQFIEKHINRFNLNDSKYRTKEFSNFLQDVIEYKAIPKKNRYCNLVVDLFIEKIKGVSKEKSIKLCELIYTQILVKSKN